MTDRLVLRPSEARDRPAYIELFSSSAVWTYLGGAGERSELELLVPEIPGNHAGIFVVEVDGQLAGTVVLERRDLERPGHVREGTEELEVSYTFLPDFWGRGYASEAVAKVIDWAGANLSDTVMLICTQTANVASMRLAGRLGFDEVVTFEEFGAEQWLGRLSLPVSR